MGRRKTLTEEEKKQKDRDRAKKWRDGHKEDLKAYRDEFYNNNREYYEQYYLENKDKINERSKRYSKQNSDVIACNRLQTTYNITLEEKKAMLASQGGLCKICGTPLDMVKKPLTANLDHCHTTGVIRGVLCTNCNRGLGYFKDKPDFLLSAIHYLNSYSTNT